MKFAARIVTLGALSATSSFAFMAKPMASSTQTVISTSSSPSSSSLHSMEQRKKDFDLSEYVQNIDFSGLSVDSISKNTMEGEVGKRGEAYTAAEFFVLFSIVIGGVPIVGDAINILLGPVLLLAGLATSVLAVVDLGESFSPWTATTSSTKLKTGGLYSQVRHPLASGILATSAGLSIFTDSADRLLLTAVLLYALNVMTDVEEKELIKKFPDEYPAYQQQVSNKFFPQSIVALLPWTEN